MVRLLCISALVLATLADASAQSQTPGPQRVVSAQAPGAGAAPTAKDDVPDTLPNAQLLVMLDSYAMFQAQQQLSISDDKFGQFAARLKRLQDVRRRNQRLRLRIIQELRRLAGLRAQERAAGAGDEAAIRAQLTALREHDDRAAAELKQAYAALDEILDIRQQARYRIFEEHIEQRKLELLVRAQQRARQK
jgi:hypothetical protein